MTNFFSVVLENSVIYRSIYWFGRCISNSWTILFATRIMRGSRKRLYVIMDESRSLRIFDDIMAACKGNIFLLMGLIAVVVIIYEIVFGMQGAGGLRYYLLPLLILFTVLLATVVRGPSKRLYEYWHSSFLSRFLNKRI